MNNELAKALEDAGKRREEHVVAFIRQVRTAVFVAMHDHGLSAVEAAGAVHALSVELSTQAMNNPWW